MSKRLRDFQFGTLIPNCSVDGLIPISINSKSPTVAAQLLLKKVKPRDEIWLNGIAGIANVNSFSVGLVLKIFKGELIFDTEIFHAFIEIGAEGNGGSIIVPIAHVDVSDMKEKNVPYTLTVDVSDSGVFIDGPITFTAALIEDDSSGGSSL